MEIHFANRGVEEGANPRGTAIGHGLFDEFVDRTGIYGWHRRACSPGDYTIVAPSRCSRGLRRRGLGLGVGVGYGGVEVRVSSHTRGHKRAGGARMERVEGMPPRVVSRRVAPLAVARQLQLQRAVST